jgi:DNA (cytosine-5)-methyltransferase 1
VRVSCDWDKYAQVTYEANFGEKPHGDLRFVESEDHLNTTFSLPAFHVSRFQFRGFQEEQLGD